MAFVLKNFNTADENENSFYLYFLCYTKKAILKEQERKVKQTNKQKKEKKFSR